MTQFLSRSEIWLYSPTPSHGSFVRRERALLVVRAAPGLGADGGLARRGPDRAVRDRRRGRADRPVPAARGRLRPAWEAGAGAPHAAGALPRHYRLRRALRRVSLGAPARRLETASEPGDDRRAAARRRGHRARRRAAAGGVLHP